MRPLIGGLRMQVEASQEEAAGSQTRFEQLVVITCASLTIIDIVVVATDN